MEKVSKRIYDDMHVPYLRVVGCPIHRSIKIIGILCTEFFDHLKCRCVSDDGRAIILVDCMQSVFIGIPSHGSQFLESPTDCVSYFGRRLTHESYNNKKLHAILSALNDRHLHCQIHHKNKKSLISIDAISLRKTGRLWSKNWKSPAILRHRFRFRGIFVCDRNHSELFL